MLFYSYCCCVWVSVAHIFPKSDADGATPAIPSGLCLRMAADLGNCPWFCQSLAEGQVELWRLRVPKTGLRMWGSFYPVVLWARVGSRFGWTCHFCFILALWLFGDGQTWLKQCETLGKKDITFKIWPCNDFSWLVALFFIFNITLPVSVMEWVALTHPHLRFPVPLAVG